MTQIKEFSIRADVSNYGWYTLKMDIEGLEPEEIYDEIQMKLRNGEAELNTLKMSDAVIDSIEESQPVPDDFEGCVPMKYRLNITEYRIEKDTEYEIINAVEESVLKSTDKEMVFRVWKELLKL